MRSRNAVLLSLSLFLSLAAGLSLTVPVAFAEPTPTSDLLLPYFEVDLTGFKRTTLFTVTNEGDDPVQVRMTVHSNWGIPLEEVTVTLDSQQTRGFNLRDWLLLGDLPQPDGTLATLSPRRLTHLQSALSGVQSPQDQMYYGTQVIPDLAVGYVILRAEGPHRDDVLWGNFYTIDPEDNSAQGDVLVDIDPAKACHDLCVRHLLFFLDGGAFDGGTEIIVWNPGRLQPQATLPTNPRVAGLDTVVRNLDGEVVTTDSQGLLATQTVTMENVTEVVGAGSLRLETRGSLGNQLTDSFIGIRYGAEQRYSATLQSWCLPLPSQTSPGRIAIDIEKLTNGEDADTPTGPQIPVGDPVQWEYVVRNTGSVALTDVQVHDDQGVAVTCPNDSLAPAQSMTCTGSGLAEAGQYANVGSVSGRDSLGRTAHDSDPSHYFGFDPEIGIDLEKATNGQDADIPTGPEIEVGDAVTWSFRVTNLGQVALSNVTVTDNREGPISCPKTKLEPQESMVCLHQGVATLGQYANLATATGTDDRNRTATDQDPSHYLGVPEPPIAVDIEKATNGHDADVTPGPELRPGSQVTWTYRVANTGSVALFDLAVTDDQEGSISCPETTLAPDESMLCMAQGIAQEGQYANLATVSGRDDRNRTAFDEDPSHYEGVPLPPIGIDLEKATNGHDADHPKGPKIAVGATVTWTYVVTNIGGVDLSDVAVTDDEEGSISCPKSTLAVGESMTCTETGTAQKGQYSNLGTVEARDDFGRTAGDTDPSHYKGVEVCLPNLTFERDPHGHRLKTGERVTEQWASLGIHITTSSPSNHPAMIFNSSSPTGGDHDLGTPNRDFGGPGRGSGGERGRAGENRFSHGKILIISEDNRSSDPDDNDHGGTMIFTFDQPTRIDAVQLLDIDDSSERGTVKAYDGSGQLLVSRTMAAVGNNGFQTLTVGAREARRLEVRFPKSGALPAIVFCAD